MKTNANAVAEDGPRARILLRRIGTSAGLSFGFLLLGLAVAGSANAEDAEDGLLSGVGGALDATLDPLHEDLSTVTEPVGSVAEPITEAAEPVVEDVAEPLVTEVVEPVAAETLEPVTEPVLEPVATAVAPVLDSVSPLVEPITAPVLDAVAPVADPVVEAAGLDPVVEAAGLEPSAAPPPEEAVPVPDRPSGAPPESGTLQPFEERPVPADAVTDSRSTTGGEVRSDPAHGQWPTGGFVIGTTAPSGLSVSASASPAADHATTVGWPSARGESIADPGPPGSEPFSEWFGYGDRDHPG
ncbi:hypothetical protein SAMN05216298_0317 [Glycomyces sambucus]|uniref:Uncharacterized protein n=1 Tax=Glycomyces sambucus TaxID=380244 RepID=A0A1G9CGA7_9ACTN|nr:hypothetical protein [Glycomyces sambucus]SDK50616.1 hypothetical protein SAMN05216298_0317 [Glycomyces sambucus]